ncbi:MAG: Eco57I restriction-modification methylase domain-containing protein, partial [Paludibacteraceae bacterium]
MDSQFLSSAYGRSVFVPFLENFLPDDFVVEEKSLNLSEDNPRFLTAATRLGYCKSLELEVYEVRHTSLHDARVGISKDAFRLLLKHSMCNKALIAFVPEEGGQWRLSLLEMTAELNDRTLRLSRSYSNPRRFSFMLGTNAKTKTPEQYLIGKGKIRERTEGNKTLTPWEDLKSRFSVEVLTKQFYNELFTWYQWAVDDQSGIYFPNSTDTSDDDFEDKDKKIIRLITRLMFVWFIKQKNLVPDSLFDETSLQQILIDFNPTATDNGNYYNAILQNLFFATLNRAIEDEEGKRGFAKLQRQRDVKTLYRYQEMFQLGEAEILKLFADVPFLNGGLFECLDKTTQIDGVEKAYNYDGFSRNDKRFPNGRYRQRAFIPNVLFFDKEKGLLNILKRYNFTIEENTPAEQTVALDPELLGKVFENLLGAYNPETRETARNQSGSFYTPREIVSYMVDESIKAYLLQAQEISTEVVDAVLSDDFERNETDAEQYRIIVEKLKSVKILDPACGSGAFPMGLLNRMVDILRKIDHQQDVYTLKLQIIENCIYGADIQSIASQISKLRFFISLICDCEKDSSKPNFGIPTLPNLETKFVTANSLIGLHKNKEQAQQLLWINSDDDPIKKKQEELLAVRHQHFRAKTAREKITLRKKDEQLRTELLLLLKQDNAYATQYAQQMASWNPYDQNVVAPFFDPEWMFGVSDGFDIVIGNPPYISTKGISANDKKAYEKEFEFSDDTYNLFTFKGVSLAKNGGSLTYIIPKTFWTTQTKRNMRELLLSKNIRYIFDTANPFESVMVDTCIIQVMNTPYNQSNFIQFRDGSKDLGTPITFPPISQSVYLHTQNAVIFKPTQLNLRIWELYGKKVKALYDKWWDKIKTSRDIEKNKEELEAYRASLKPGDVALLGCLTEGGQGLATANNGKYIAIRKSSKWADNVYTSRPKKLTEAIKKYPQISDYINNLTPQVFLRQSSEQQIAETFDKIKEDFGRDIFGQGYIFRLIDDCEIADVDMLTDDEKENGIATDHPYYVPYDKGDKDGNRWFLETPFAIAWSKDNVHFLKT